MRSAAENTRRPPQLKHGAVGSSIHQQQTSLNTSKSVVSSLPVRVYCVKLVPIVLLYIGTNVLFVSRFSIHVILSQQEHTNTNNSESYTWPRGERR